jgi:shikimate kinase
MPSLPRPIILIGFMASGKSHVARLISKHFDAPVIDLDARIEAACGASIPEFFATRGEAAFRKIESETLRQVLRETAQKPAVVATGGGVITNENNRTLLRNAAETGTAIIYLRATPETLAKRIRQEPGKRPLIDGDRMLNMEETQERVKVLLEGRRAFYESSANVIIDTNHHDATNVATEIVERLHTD